MSLSSGYKRLEYIESTGTQYIDTGFKPNQNTRAVIDFEMLSSSNGAIFGSRVSASGNSFAFLYNVSGGSLGRDDYASNKSAVSSVPIIGAHHLDKNKNETLYDTETFSYAETAFSINYSVYLFGLNTGGSLSHKGIAKLYSCQIYDNGTLIRDFIPCQKPDGTIGLWDDANGVFYGNAGTGTFTAGPVLAIAANASEITELKYIQSSGTQYINTAFPPNQRTRVVCDTVFAAVSAGTWLFGARHGNADRTFGFLTYKNNYRSDFGTSSSGTITETQSSRFTVDKDGNITKINGTTVSTAPAETFQCLHSIFLFANNNNGTVGGYGTATVYSCQVYDNGTLIRDYIAAKLSDGTIGLYDKLHGLLYINMGTGTFTAGPVVTSPSIFVNINGIWKPINNIYVNINNIWQKST